MINKFWTWLEIIIYSYLAGDAAWRLYNMESGHVNSDAIDTTRDPDIPAQDVEVEDKKPVDPEGDPAQGGTENAGN